MNPFANQSVCSEVDSNSCDLVYRFTENETLAVASAWLIGKPLAIIALVLLGWLARWLLHRLIDRVTSRASGGVVPYAISRGRKKNAERAVVAPTHASARREQRAKTMGSLLKSVVTGVIFTMVVIMAIAELGYDVAPLIASAGIVGVALGFGAQSLVKDFLSGIFMIFEDQYGVGDVIDAGEATGTVEAVSLRVTRLRDIDGTVWYVRNGEILRIGNMSQNWARTVLDVQVAYGEDIRRVRQVLAEVAHSVWDDEDFQGMILEEPEVWGIQSLDADGVTVRLVLKTAPLEQWGVAREMRERIKARFDLEGIEIPFPQRVIWNRDSAEAPVGDRQPSGPGPEGADSEPGTAGTAAERGTNPSEREGEGDPTGDEPAQARS